MKQIYKGLLFITILLFLTILMAIVPTTIAAVDKIQTGTEQVILTPTNNFLKIDSIPGESTTSGHAKEIDILSWSFGVSKTGGKLAGKSNFEDLKITKVFDKSSPILFLTELTGKSIPKMILSVRKANKNQDFLTITMENVTISSYNTNGSDSGIIDELSFSFGRILIAYNEQNAEGATISTTTAGWDLKTNKAI